MKSNEDTTILLFIETYYKTIIFKIWWQIKNGLAYNKKEKIVQR